MRNYNEKIDVNFFTNPMTAKKSDELMDMLEQAKAKTTQAMADALAVGDADEFNGNNVIKVNPATRLLIARARKSLMDKMNERFDAIERKLDLIIKASVPMF